MALAPGTELGPYRITGPLGAGGMGEVYRATDTKLHRDVAIKVLPDAFARDEQRMKRLEREAHVLASLNHPHIAAIYGLEKNALVLELVEGPTLAERIAEGPIPLGEAIRIARQMALGLEAAHEKAVIHRDLKPANVKLTKEGDVKILDFGLAKFAEAETDASGSSVASHSPTLTRAATQEGVLLGTAAYMSPEQAKGKPVDKRTDVWAFGAVLYEMLTGKRAFAGEDVSETLALVLTKEPDFKALSAETPLALRQVLRGCLSKDPRSRLRDIGDVLLLMEGGFEAACAPSSERARSNPWIWSSALVVASVLSGLAVWNWKPEAPRPLTRVVATPPSAEPLDLGQPDGDVAISLDGTRIVYPVSREGGRHLVVRALDRLEAVPLGGLGNLPRHPFLSPDGNWIGYFDGIATLRKVSILGGPPVTLCALPDGAPRGASWGDDGTIIFATTGPRGLFRVAAGGGEPEELTKPAPGQGDHQWPEILPGGEAVLFTILRGPVEPVENAQIAVVSLRTGESKVLVPGGSHPRYVSTGHIVYGVGGTLRAVGFDRKRLEVTSDPVPVLEGVVTKGTGAADFAISEDGSLVYVEGPPIADVERTLVWVDRQGHEETLKAPPRTYLYPRLSPDGSRLALDVRGQENDIWIWDFVRETPTRLTFDPSEDSYPAWTPDGLRVAFSSGAPANLFWKAADGTGTVERLSESPSEQHPYAFTPDGRQLVFRKQSPGRGWDLGVLSLEGKEPPAPLLSTEFNELNAEFSPDGRYLAYQSDESGQNEVYVRPFPRVEEGRWQVSRDGGTRPLWARNGRELFYMTQGGQVMAVSVQTEPGVAFGNAELVVEGTYFAASFGRTYDVSPDGERFLMIQEARAGGEASPAELILVLNWGDELKRLVPARN